jgi:hypothetical protein
VISWFVVTRPVSDAAGFWATAIAGAAATPHAIMPAILARITMHHLRVQAAGAARDAFKTS